MSAIIRIGFLALIIWIVYSIISAIFIERVVDRHGTRVYGKAEEVLHGEKEHKFYQALFTGVSAADDEAFMRMINKRSRLPRPGKATPRAHVAGNTNSGMLSFTKYAIEAVKYAQQPEDKRITAGAVGVTIVEINEIIPCPQLWGEGECLIGRAVYNMQVFHINEFDTPAKVALQIERTAEDMMKYAEEENVKSKTPTP